MRMLAAVREDRRKEVRMMAVKHNIQTQNLAMKKVCVKIVPRVLTDERKERRIACCREWQFEGGDFFYHVITGDKSSAYKYNLEAKSQSRE